MTHEIEDVFGNLVCVGDKVAYRNTYGNLAHKGLARGVIIRLTEKSVVVEDLDIKDKYVSEGTGGRISIQPSHGICLAHMNAGA